MDKELRSGERTWKWTIAGAMVIATATVIAYLPALRAGYIWDDDEYLTNNALVQTPDGLSRIWFTTETPQYYPMVFTSFWLEFRLWGLNASGYHAVNIALHVINALLIWRLTRRIGIPWPWFVGLVFAVHPVETESVAWVTERKNVLSALFYLLAFGCYLRFDALTPASSSPSAPTGRWKWYAASLLLFLAALLSKSVTATLPVVILLVLLHKRRLNLLDAALIAPMFLLGVFFGIHTANLERVKVGAEGAEWSAGFAERLIVACRALWFYAAKIVWPWPLTFIYPRWTIDPGNVAQYVPVLGVLLAVAAAGFGAMKRNWSALLLIAFCAVTLFPALGFLNVFPHRFSYVADHFNYLGSIGFIIMATTTVHCLLRAWAKAKSARIIAAALAVVIPIALVTITWSRGWVYANAETLWKSTLRDNPEAWIALVNLSAEYCRTNRYDEAEPLLQRAIQYPLAKDEALVNLAQISADRGRHDQSVAMMQEVLRRHPTAPLFSDYGVILKRAKRLDEAAAALEQSIQLAPEAPVPWQNLARVRAEQGRFDDAERCIRRAIELLPRAEFYTYLGNLLVTMGRHAQAVEPYQAAIARNGAEVEAAFGLSVAFYEDERYEQAAQVCREWSSRFPKDVRLANQMSWILSTSPVDSIRNGQEALRLVQYVVLPAIKLTPISLDTYSAALAEVGRFADAVTVATDGLALAEKEGDGGKAAELKARLELYRANRPYRHAVRKND